MFASRHGRARVPPGVQMDFSGRRARPPLPRVPRYYLTGQRRPSSAPGDASFGMLASRAKAYTLRRSTENERSQKMRNSHTQSKTRRLFAVAALCAMAALPLLAAARSASINVVNNSGREVIHIYLAHADRDDWGPNQLGDSTIRSGQSYTLSNLSWDQSQVKVVAEDRDGCFLSSVVSATDDSSWTITNDTPADCGSSGGAGR